MNLNVKKMKEFLDDFRDNDPDFGKIKKQSENLSPITHSGTLFWKIGDGKVFCKHMFIRCYVD